MKIILLILLSIPSATLAQFEQNPQQQAVWSFLKSAAPMYEILEVCEKSTTKEFLWNDIVTKISPVITNSRQQRIVGEMWNKARQEARIEDRQLLTFLRKNKNGDAEEICDDAEIRVIHMLGLSI